MADIDVGQLEALVGELRQKSQRFSAAAQQMINQAKQLDGAAQDLADNATSWAGKGSSIFMDTWLRYHGDTLRSAIALDSASQVLSKLAQKLDDAAQQIMSLQAQEAAGVAVTVGLVLLDVAQLGMDPVTDAATVGAGGADGYIAEEIAAEQEAIAEMDSEISAEIDEITSQIENSTDLTQLSSEVLDEELQNLEDADSMLARRNGLYQNPINMSNDSTPQNMPPGVNNAEGKYWIQQIESKGIRVEWNRPMQVQLENDEGYAGTYNYNSQGASSGDPQLVVVGLSPDATPAAVYEEYLHVEAAEARNWVPLGTNEAKWAEEIEVEYQVLQNAGNLQMTSQEYQELSQLRQSYIQKLQASYQQQGLAWPPPDLAQYLQDPPMPPNLP